MEAFVATTVLMIVMFVLYVSAFISGTILVILMTDKDYMNSKESKRFLILPVLITIIFIFIATEILLFLI